MEKNEKKKASVLLLEIKRSKQDKTYHVALKSEDKHQPQETQPTDKPQTWDFPWEKEDLLAQLYRARVLTEQEAENRGVDLDNFPQLYLRRARADLKKMGDKFYDALFPPDSPTRQTLETRLQEAGKQGHILSLRLQLDPDDAELWAFPWELLYAHWIEENGDMTANFTQTLRTLAIIRYLPKKEAKPIFTRLQRIAFFAASPRGGAIPTHQTFEAIRSAWGVDRVLDAPNGGQSWKDWRALMAQSPDAVHFLGHGNENDQLAFVGEGNSPDLKGADKITNSLPTSLMLLTLQACSSGHLAARLIQKHPQLPLAVGMHYEIGIEVADAFAQGFYRTLLTSGRVEAAIAQARQHMLESSKDNQWLLPIQTMGVPEAYFSSKYYRNVSISPPILTDAIERPILQKSLRTAMAQAPITLIIGAPDSGRTWLTIQTLQTRNLPHTKTLLLDLTRENSNIFDLWHTLLAKLERKEVAHLDAPELDPKHWEILSKALTQAFKETPSEETSPSEKKFQALILKLPSTPPAQDATDYAAWKALFAALRELPRGASILILDEKALPPWQADEALIGKDLKPIRVPPPKTEEIIALAKRLLNIELTEEEIRMVQMTAPSMWAVRQFLLQCQGQSVQEILAHLAGVNSLLQPVWDAFDTHQREILKWLAIADRPLTSSDLLSLLNQSSLTLKRVQEMLSALEQRYWLYPEEGGYVLFPTAHSFALEQVREDERQRKRKQWTHYQALTEQDGQIRAAFAENNWEEAANLLLSEAWHPWAISLSYRYKLLEFIAALWERKDELPSDIPFKLAMRAALAARALGDYEMAAHWYERAAHTATNNPDKARALIEMAWVRHRIGQLTQEEQRDIENLLAEINAPSLEARWRFILGTIHAEQWEYHEAAQAVLQGLKALSLPAEAIQSLDNNASPTAFSVHDITPLQDALKQWASSSDGDPHLAALATRAYGLAALYGDNLPLAESLLKLSLDFYKETGGRYWIAIAHNNYASALARGGKREKADFHFKQAKAILDEIGNPAFLQLITLFNQSLEREFSLAPYSSIINGFQEALEFAKSKGFLHALPSIYFEYGKALGLHGQWQEAWKQLEQAHKLTQTTLENPLLTDWATFYQAELSTYRHIADPSWYPDELDIIKDWLHEDQRPSLKADPRLRLIIPLLLAFNALLRKDAKQAQDYLAPLDEASLPQDPTTRIVWHQNWMLLAALEKNRRDMSKHFRKGQGYHAQYFYRTMLRYLYASSLFTTFGDKVKSKELLNQIIQECQKMEIPWLQRLAEQQIQQIEEA